jgi:SnoaL-like polyketide cyclase
MELMKTLDDAWNSQDWKTFEERHADNVAVFWPGQPEPTRRVHRHREESIQFFKAFPDNHLVNNPYKIQFYKDDYTCSVADFAGTFKGPMKGLNGQMIQPTIDILSSFYSVFAKVRKEYAAILDLNIERFNNDLFSHVYAGRIHEDFISGIRSGVKGNPTNAARLYYYRRSS